MSKSEYKKEIEEGMRKIPTDKRKEIMKEEKKKERIEMIEIKKSLWK